MLMSIYFIRYFYLLFVILDLRYAVFAQSFQNELVQRSDCVCIGYTLIYECTVLGRPGGATVWTGTAFDCPGDEITLLHNRFPSDNGPAFGECNDGAIQGRSVRVENNWYTSQLNVTVSFDMIGESIVCIHDDTSGSENIVGSSTINDTTAPLPPPEKVSIIRSDLNLRQFIFNWSPVATDCFALHYNITASNCGSCPTTTTNTAVTCTDVPTDGSVCTLALKTTVCGNITGNQSSDSVQGILKGHLGCTGAITSASFLAVLLAVCVTVLMIMITILVIQNKDKIKAPQILRERQRKKDGSTSDRSTYEDVRHEPTKVIDTGKNVAYGQTIMSLNVTH